MGEVADKKKVVATREIVYKIYFKNESRNNVVKSPTWKAIDGGEGLKQVLEKSILGTAKNRACLESAEQCSCVTITAENGYLTYEVELYSETLKNSYMNVSYKFYNGKDINYFLKIPLPKYEPYLMDTTVEGIKNDIKKQIPSRWRQFLGFFGFSNKDRVKTSNKLPSKKYLWNLGDSRKFDNHPVEISFKVKIQ